MSELTGSFIAVDDDGNEYTIGIYRDVIDTTTHHSTRREQTYSSLATLLTDDGRHVNRVDQGAYEIVGHPMIPLTSTDPSAP